MKLAIVGYGKMGRMVEQFAPDYGFTIHSKIDAKDPLSNAKGADVAIEFSAPEAALAQHRRARRLWAFPRLPALRAGFEELDRVKKAVAEHDAALIWSANFSVGVNVLLRALHEVSRLLANEPGYEAWAWEIHHSAKKDAPSGTLLALVREMQKAGTRAMSIKARTALARLPGRTRSASIARKTPSRCATRLAARGLRARRSARGANDQRQDGRFRVQAIY